MILAGDIGGTKADLALFERSGSPRSPTRERRFPTRDFTSLHELVSAFLDGEAARLTSAVIGIAGPVRDNRCETTNLPWTIDGRELGAAFGGIRVQLLNDLEATAWGLTMLGPGDLEELQPGVPATGTRALIAAGTGLGESIVARVGDRWIPIPSEGGHGDFAPRDPIEDELLAWLRTRYGHVSYERVLSGPGLADLYRFIGDSGRDAGHPEVAARFAAAEDPAAIVTEAALAGTCRRAGLALEMFVDVYGAEAGNLALKGLALGGVYLGGGIAPRIVPRLRDGRFVSAFNDKGRLSPVMNGIRVWVVLDPRTALWGAATYAYAVM